MAAYSLIIAFAHATGIPEVISGPEVPVTQQRELYKENFLAERVHEKFAKVELLHSRRGVIKSKQFITPAESKRRAKEIARQEKEFESMKKQKPSAPETPPQEAPPAETPPETPPE
jgi:hypothetical protein